MERKAVIKNADMSEEMQQDALDCATAALEKFNIEKVCNILRPTTIDINKTEQIRIDIYFLILLNLNI